MALSDIDSALDFIAKRKQNRVKAIKLQRKELRQLEQDKKRDAKEARTLERQRRTEKRAIRSAELAEKKERRAGRRERVSAQAEGRSVEAAARARTKFGQGQIDRRSKLEADTLKRSLEVAKRKREGGKRKREGVGQAAKLQKEFLPVGAATPGQRQGEAALAQLLQQFEEQLRPGSAEQLFRASSAGQRTTIPNSLVSALSDESGLNPFEISQVAPEGQSGRLASLLRAIVAQSSKEKETDALAGLFGGGGAPNIELETARLEGLVPEEFQQNPAVLDLIQKLKLARSLGGVDLNTPSPAVPSKNTILDFFRQ